MLSLSCDGLLYSNITKMDVLYDLKLQKRANKGDIVAVMLPFTVIFLANKGHSFDELALFMSGSYHTVSMYDM